ncbi:MAG TPA: type VI secretion system baseplate subunit TssK [Gemmatimonadaceae bacterium]|nr:type VI secretion system baseplate subunit TssK [Gemmatimonadaceae bacterium]
MTLLSKVVWHEGMHLAQHHFQTQSRYFEDSIRFAVGQLYYKPYGITACELDANAIANGVVSLVHAQGVMPDGLAFYMPDADTIPDARDIRQVFSPTHDSHLVMLAVPPFVQNGANCDQPRGGGSQSRFRLETRSVRDDTTGRDDHVVELGEKNFRLILDSERQSDEVALPIARVHRDGAGKFAYDPTFIAPCLHLAASDTLMTTLTRLVQMLDAKSDELSRARQASGRGFAEFAAHEVATFWIQHTVNAGVAALRHHMKGKDAHPERLFVDLSRLAGALCTFALDAHPRDLPLYDHDDLGTCFAVLEQRIRASLGVIIPSNTVRIPLTRDAEYLFSGTITDRQCFGKARWLLGLRSSAPDATIIGRVPQLVKVCSKRFTIELVRRARSGLTVEYVQVPPVAVSPRADTHYFSVGRVEPCWRDVSDTGEIGVYVPDTFPDAEVELLVVLES